MLCKSFSPAHELDFVGSLISSPFDQVLNGVKEMLKLIKWIGIGSVAVAATGFFLFGGQTLSYISTAADSIREGIKEEIPVEYELKRASKLIQAIDPQIRGAKLQVAKAEVSLENTKKDIDRLARSMARSKDKLRAVSASLNGDGVVSYELSSYRRQRVEIDLQRTFEAHKNNEVILRSKRALVARQERSVATASTRLDAIRAEKSRLVDMIASLKTQKMQLDAMAASSVNIQLDDSALGQAKDVLSEIKNRLDVAQKLMEADIFFGPQTEEEATVNANVALEVQKYLTGESQPNTLLEVAADEPVYESR